MALKHTDLVEVKQVRGKGRGVFARRAIGKGEVIERVPVIVLSADQAGNDPREHDLSGYCFEWGEGTVALALGFGSLYNHSYRPNARYDDVGRLTKVFTALRDIAAGEEITVNYNGGPEDRSPVWFEVIEDGVTGGGRPRASARGVPARGHSRADRGPGTGQPISRAVKGSTRNRERDSV